MREVLAVQQRVLATVHRVYEAAFLIEISRHDLLYQLIRLTALLGGRLREFRFLLGCEMYFHDAQNTGKTPRMARLPWGIAPLRIKKRPASKIEKRAVSVLIAQLS